MRRDAFVKECRLRARHRAASTCFLDEDGLYGRVVFGGQFFSFTVTHRWSGSVVFAEEIWPWMPAFGVCVRNWSAHVASILKRIKREEGSVPSRPAVDPQFAQAYPGLFEHLTVDWLEGSRRETSTLGISTDGGRWKGRLCDRENGMVLFVTGDGFDAVLGALERAVHDPAADWRVDTYADKQRGGKRR